MNETKTIAPRELEVELKARIKDEVKAAFLFHASPPADEDLFAQVDALLLADPPRVADVPIHPVTGNAYIQPIVQGLVDIIVAELESGAPENATLEGLLASTPPEYSEEEMARLAGPPPTAETEVDDG